MRGWSWCQRIAQEACLIRGQRGLFGPHEDVITRRKSIYWPKSAWEGHAFKYSVSTFFGSDLLLLRKNICAVDLSGQSPEWEPVERVQVWVYLRGFFTQGRNSTLQIWINIIWVCLDWCVYTSDTKYPVLCCASTTVLPFTGDFLIRSVNKSVVRGGKKTNSCHVIRVNMLLKGKSFLFHGSPVSGSRQSFEQRLKQRSLH